MNPFLAAVLRIAQGHYGGRPNPAWLKKMQAAPESQTTIGQNLAYNLGTGTPGQIQSIQPGHAGPYGGW